MDEMQTLREYHDARPGPSPEVVAEARARLDARTRTRERHVRAWRRRYVLGAAAVGAAVAVTVPLSTLGGGPGGDQAFAAERLADGRIRVTMDELTGPPDVVQRRLDGIERELAAMGLKADIDLIPFGHRCSVSPRGDVDQVHHPVVSIGSSDPNEEQMVFYVRPDLVKPGNTLAWTVSVRHRDGRSAAAIGTAAYQVRGPAEPCDPVPLGQQHP
ncbi:hypothetical protein E1281_13755 [Actinomadura sp. KC345]|uniref:hypothetical protein n=1 Tax=Actinomadura sp. KC345 TaxID=2530371 RepID=UPI00104C2F2D|nr:hypothetical protein [Actinomadura sp. KC345]TDC55227.1 hypothetical protein E1281_13755 [Actinomadura sp. KC345]